MTMRKTLNLGSRENIHEVEFIKAFVIPQKKQRFLEFVNGKRGREKFTSELDHPNFISSEFIKEIPPSQQTAPSIGLIFNSKNAPAICHVISSNSDIDQTELPTIPALEKTVAQGFGTILSFIPGKLVYFENEDGDMRFIMEK